MKFPSIGSQVSFADCRACIFYKTYLTNTLNSKPMNLDLVTQRLLAMNYHSNNSQTNLYQHLSKLVPRLAQFQKQKISPIANLEYISEYVKKYDFKPNTPLTEQQLQMFVSMQTQYPPWLQQQEAIRQQPKGDTKQIIIQNYDQQAERLFSLASIGFGKEESHLIYAALKRLAVQKKAERVRFWGRIMTGIRDYLIAEGYTRESNAGDPPTQDTEKVKEGANYNTYWVTQDIISGQWYELPLVTPEQIRVSRLIKQVFTGELNRPIVSSPPFKGQEKHLLKAQIVRITHNCQIAPKGLYNPLEQNADQIDFAQDFKMPEFGDLTNLQNWVHINPYLLKLGRGSYFVDPKLTEQQKEEVLAKLGENDPKVQRLKAVNQDKGLQKFGLEGCWSARVYGNTQVFNNVGKQEGTTSCYGVVALRNPHWPGWTTVASSKQFGSIYIGYGLKASQPSFYPLGPEDLSLQAEDVQQCHEPNPKDPPDELEPDSDEENKKPQE